MWFHEVSEAFQRFTSTWEFYGLSRELHRIPESFRSFSIDPRGFKGVPGSFWGVPDGFRRFQDYCRDFLGVSGAFHGVLETCQGVLAGFKFDSWGFRGFQGYSSGFHGN